MVHVCMKLTNRKVNKSMVRFDFILRLCAFRVHVCLADCDAESEVSRQNSASKSDQGKRAG